MGWYLCGVILPPASGLRYLLPLIRLYSRDLYQEILGEHFKHAFDIIILSTRRHIVTVTADDLYTLLSKYRFIYNVKLTIV